jgi:YD repeat-containing protein
MDSRLTQLTHTSGQSLTFTYNLAGLVSQVADGSGRTTTFQYDTNQHLLTAIGFDGRTTEYTYSNDIHGLYAHALASVKYDNGTHIYFSYDSQDRLSETHRDDGAEPLSFSYEIGNVIVTNALG